MIVNPFGNLVRREPLPPPISEAEFEAFLVDRLLVRLMGLKLPPEEAKHWLFGRYLQWSGRINEGRADGQ